MHAITNAEFARFQRFIFDAAGITLSSSKQALVTGRLGKRLSHHQLGSFDEYLQLISSGEHADEMQMAVDLLTTNETYFFRESKHFDFLGLRAAAAASRSEPFRVWSAASSSGEEAYSIAMVLADSLHTTPWEVLGTDISTKVLEQAARALYPMERARQMPPDMLRRYCRKGTGDYAGCLLVERSLREHVRFAQLRLNQPLPSLGSFDIVFLRNVMIYFNEDTKRGVVARVCTTLKPGGWLLVGHSETLTGLTDAVEQVAPSIYRKPA